MNPPYQNGFYSSSDVALADQYVNDVTSKNAVILRRMLVAVPTIMAMTMTKEKETMKKKLPLPLPLLFMTG